MSIKHLRLKKNLSQEQLAETVGLSLRTIQRAESGKNIANSSWAALADYFGVHADSLKEYYRLMGSSSDIPSLSSRLGQHRAAQLIIFIVTFFVCIAQWMAYFAEVNASPSDASLATILGYLFEIALGAAIFAYLFSYAKVTFIWSYYVTAAAFVICAIGIDFWWQPATASDAMSPLFPVFYTLMLLALLVFHVLQMTLSLQGETVVISRQNSLIARKLTTD